MNEHEVAFDSYTRAVQSLILDFQFIEELLKIVIGGSYEAIRRSAPSIVRFRPNRSVLEKESLGRLIQRYEEVSDNDPLIQNLRQVVGDRNFCANRQSSRTAGRGRAQGYLLERMAGGGRCKPCRRNVSRPEPVSVKQRSVCGQPH